MATLDQLTAEQRAILEMLVRRGRSYQGIADLLDISPGYVRNQAHAALDELSPLTAEAVAARSRPPIADYLLGQQSRNEASRTLELIDRSDAARSWALSVADSLSGLYGADGPPELPRAKAGGSPAPTETAPAPPPRPRPQRTRLHTRRRLVAGGALALVALVVAGILLLTGGSGSAKRKAAAPKGQLVGELALQPIRGSGAQAIAVLAKRAAQYQLLVQGKLKPTRTGQAYLVWLTNTGRDALVVGAQVTSSNGNYLGAGPLASSWSHYKYIELSLISTTGGKTHFVQNVAVGAFANMRLPTGSGSP